MSKVPFKIVDSVIAGNTVRYDGKNYIPKPGTDMVFVNIDNEQYYKTLYDKYRYVIEYLIEIKEYKNSIIRAGNIRDKKCKKIQDKIDRIFSNSKTPMDNIETLIKNWLQL